MRTYEEYERILQLWERGLNKLEISQITEIPRRTVTDCIEKYQSVEGLQYAATHTIRKVITIDHWSPEYRQAYVYLFGLYLGDGTITPARNSHRLRIFLDQRQPNILQHCVKAIETVMPGRKVGLVHRETQCVDVSCYANAWLDLFPQHGEGRKHDRKIEMVAWQRDITTEYPLEFFRGLYHSDGSRFEPVIYNRVYARYQFTNLSPDIRQFFADTCDQLGIHYTFYGVNFTIARRKDVAYLDSVIGKKS